jgi:hypothetical protein
MRVSARLARTKLTLFTRSSATSWATDGEYLFQAESFFHGADMMPRNQHARMVNLGQSMQFLFSPFSADEALHIALHGARALVEERSNY